MATQPTSVSNVVANPVLVEYGKFIRLDGDTRFPAISVTEYDYYDTTQAYKNSNIPPVTSVSVYPKYAVLTYNTNDAGSSGITYLSGSGTLYRGNFGAILPLTDTVIAGLTASYTDIDTLKGATLPKGVMVPLYFQAISANSGTAILYYND